MEAFLTVDEDAALAQAEEVGKGLLSGVPYALKDNICTEGIRTTAASRILENYIPPYSATVANKLKAAGGVLIGKTNLDEFAMGSTTETSAFKKTKNPYGKGYVPGGSSGGSAAAVAAGIVPFALGSDTGGSIRQPAAFCGVFGLKPTYGRVSRYGLIAFASSLDQIGPFTNTAEDAALVMNAICGLDEYDSTSANVETEDFTRDLGLGVRSAYRHRSQLAGGGAQSGGQTGCRRGDSQAGRGRRTDCRRRTPALAIRRRDVLLDCAR